MNGKLQKVITGPHTEKICHTCIDKKFDSQNFVIVFNWNDANGKEHQRSFSHLPKPVKRAEALELELELAEIDQVNKTAKVFLTTTKYIRNAWVYSSVFGVAFDRNFIDLLPGKHEFTVQFRELPSRDQIWVKWM